MGQTASIETSAPASQQMSNILPADATQNVRVLCVEASNETMEKLQAAMHSGCDAAALNALPSKVLDTTCDATVAQVQAFLAPPTDADAADAKPLYLFALRKTTEVATATSEEEANGLMAVPPTMTLRELITCPGVLTVQQGESTTEMFVVYSSEDHFGNDMLGLCCIAALIAAVCACCVGLCCCGASAMSNSSKPTKTNTNNNQNSGYYNNNTNNSNYMANPNYGSQPMNNYGLPPNQGQPQYGNQGNPNYNGYQQPPQQPQQPTGTQTNPLQPTPL